MNDQNTVDRAANALDRAARALLNAAEKIRELKDWQRRAVAILLLANYSQESPEDNLIGRLIKEAEEKP